VKRSAAGEAETFPGRDFGFVDISFTLNGQESSYNIALEVSFDAGNVYTAILPESLNGDLVNIPPGVNKQITWDSPNVGATNEVGWSGLPGGYRQSQGGYGELGATGVWWTSTEIDGTLAWGQFIINNDLSIIHNNDFSKWYGLSVRCVWEENPQTTLPSVITAAAHNITSQVYRWKSIISWEKGWKASNWRDKTHIYLIFLPIRQEFI